MYCACACMQRKLWSGRTDPNKTPLCKILAQKWGNALWTVIYFEMFSTILEVPCFKTQSSCVFKNATHQVLPHTDTIVLLLLTPTELDAVHVMVYTLAVP